MAEANRMVREHAEGHPNLAYADLATPLLDDNGSPKDVFVEDGLHLNEQGYRLWQQALVPYLEIVSPGLNVRLSPSDTVHDRQV
jgi:lysophospholipase L1-like esterase